MPSKNIRAGLRSVSFTTKAGASYAFDVGGTATITPGRKKREVKSSATRGFAGVKETPMAGKIVIQAIDAQDLALADIDDWDDVTCTVVLANGKSYTCEGSSTEPPELDAIEGEFNITIEGEVTEVTFG